MRLCADILTKDGLAVRSTLEIDDSGLIARVSPGVSPAPDYDFGEALIVPGFVDLHVHGAGGSDFMDGDVEAVRTVTRTHARYGSTSLLATTLTAERSKIDQAILAIVKVAQTPAPDEAAIQGIHLEGPYICAKRRGAQPEAAIRPPDIEELDHWQTLSGGRIRQITMAPELEGALPFITYAAQAGINVSLGHTDATSQTADLAIEAGARMGTHLFNAMTGVGHRAPGVAGALLADDRVTCELICDGFHVDQKIVKIAFRAKGASNIVLITDAMSGASMPDGSYLLGGQTAVVQGGTAKLIDGALAGSVLTMNSAFMNIAKYSGCSLLEASRMSSLNALSKIGLSSKLGTIEGGKLADLAVLDPVNGEVEATFRAGRIVFRR